MTIRNAAVILLTLGLAGAADAGDVYRWTDDKGVVHFADVPPPSVKTYATETMTGRAPIVAPEPAAPGAPPAAGDAAAKAGEEPPRTGEPARVVIVDREEVSLGGSAQSFSGKIKNQGGTAAHAVTIAIRVVEPTQGDECINDEISVSSTLAPGDTATFEADYNSPCFAGPTQTELRVEWD